VFVTFDGPNGVGKTSASRRLGGVLRETGISVDVLREPSDSEVGTFAREHDDLVGMPLAALVVADRYVQIERDIKPALSAERTVVCDRYVASTLVLQRIDGLDPAVLWEMNAQALIPDLSVVLFASAPTLYRRLAQRGRVSRFDRMEGIAELELAYYRDATLFLREAGYRILVLDTDDISVAEVVDRVFREMRPLR
jgi:dTMP kinase